MALATGDGAAARCGFCGQPREEGDVVRGRSLVACRDCVRLGLTATLSGVGDANGGHTLAGGHAVCSLCDKPSPAAALYSPPASASSRACTTCLGEAYGLLTEQAALHDRRALLLHSARNRTAAHLLLAHFAGLADGDVVTSSRTFPTYFRPDLQRVLDSLLGGARCVGLHRSYEHTTCDYAALTDTRHDAVLVAPIQYEDVDTGDAEPVRCIKTGLWLCSDANTPYALLLSREQQYGQAQGWHVEVAVPPGTTGEALAARLLARIEEAAQASASYRGKVLSLECEPSYRGMAPGCLIVHRLAPVTREQIILPETTLAVLERNVFRFLAQRRRLRELSMPIKKGLLFYGPPGTGKTHTVRYLAGELREHTTLLVTAEQVGIIAEYLALARLLSPAIVVIEDVDLIARDREDLETPIQESLLNRLLNEMDGLREQAEVLFILTTNRPQTLERALAGRPGRIDQAVEFPLPDDSGRRRLIDLYRNDLVLPEEVVDEAVRRTAGVSPAFIKELMRRVAQQAVERDPEGSTASRSDLDAALAEMLFEGGTLNAALLGAEGLAAATASLKQ
jgi:hypothetical protein